VAGAIRNGCPSRQTGRTVGKFVDTKSTVLSYECRRLFDSINRLDYVVAY